MEKIAKGDKNMEHALYFMRSFVIHEKNLSIFDSIKDRERNAKEEGLIETAKNMLKKGFSIKDISDITNLPVEEIENIK